VTAELRDHVLVATEHIRARPEVVFPYLTEPALLTAWLCDTALAEGRPGGALRLDMGPVQVLGSYLVVEPPHRVGFTWDVPGWADPPPASSTVKIALPRTAPTVRTPSSSSPTAGCPPPSATATGTVTKS